MRQILSYVAVVLGSLIILGDLFSFTSSANSSASGAYRGGELVGFVLSIAMIYGGVQEINSQHLRRKRYLPWMVGFMAAMVILAVVAFEVPGPAYPPSVQATFLNRCEASGGPSGYCGCALKWFESHKSLSEFVAIDAQVRDGGGVPWDVSSGLASSCPH